MKALGKKIGMLILSIMFSHATLATDYYFSTSNGDDTRAAALAQNPSTPWKSINKLNSIFSSLKAGDAVYFKRGDEFYGTIHMNASGKAGNPIRLGAFGSGNEPVVTSFQKLEGWNTIGNGIVESNTRIKSNAVRILLIDKKIHHMGRFPNEDTNNEGYLKISSINGTERLTSNQLSASPNWQGADVIIKKNQWIIDTHKISNHSGNSISYTGAADYSARENYGFFIQNHISTLDKFGEWYYNPSSKKIRLFFGSEAASNRLIEVSTLDNLLTKTYGTSHISIQNLHFRGANSDLIYLTGGKDIRLSNLKMEFAGENGILAKSVVDIKVENNFVSDSYNNGIFLRYGNTNASVKSNIVKNSGISAGGVQNGDMAGIGILAMDDNSNIEGNEVYNTGYSGIYFTGNNSVVKNNFVDNFCLIKGDGGGIYTYVGPSNRNYQNLKIISNVIINGKGSLGGLPNIASNPRGMAEGIFLDDNSNGVEISNNTVAHTENSGIKMSNVRNISVKDNFIYNTDHNITLANSELGADVRNVIISNNVFFAKTNLQNSYTFHSHKNDISSMGLFDKNVFFRPFGDSYSIFSRLNVNGSIQEKRHNLSGFKSAFGKDLNSVSNEISFSKFENLVIKGSNLYGNGQFNGNPNGIDFYSSQSSILPNKINGRTLQVVNKKDSFFFLKLGNLKKDKKYLVKFKSLSSKNMAISTHFRHSGSPWQIISSVVTFDVTTDLSEFETILSPLADVADAGIIFSINQPDITYWLDDLEIVEVQLDEVRPEDKILFEFNASKQSKNISLQGKYVDARLKEYTGTLTLAPYSGIALFKTMEFKEPSGNNKLEDPKMVLSLNRNINNIQTKDTISITLEIPNNENAKITAATFYCGLKEIGKFDSYPFQMDWIDLPYGKQYIWASMNDGNGRIFNSEEIDLYIKKAKIPAELPTEIIQDNPKLGFGTLEFGTNGIYIKTGSTRDATFNGVNFSSEFKDKNFSGGNIESNPSSSSEYLFQSQRFAKELIYDIPLKNGIYHVVTFHNEVYFGKKVATTGPNRRVYSISIEQKIVRKDFDLFVENKNNPASLLFREIEVKDGRLTIKLESLTGDAAISGIAILPASKTNGNNPVAEKPAEKVIALSSIHINTGSTRSGEYKGIPFETEYSGNFISTGNIESHIGTSRNSMMQSQRFGKELIYQIPVKNGKYNIITYHNEVFFGKKVSSTGPNRRVYSISIQDKVVKKNFDLFVENNNNEVALEHKEVEVLNGFLKIRLVSVIGDAAISGISIIPQGQEASRITETKNPSLPQNGIYINSGSTRDADFNGIKFKSEFGQKHFSGGNIESYALASDQELFRSQRFAKNLLYTIPLPNGEYTVITYHNEVYFGKRVATTGAGRRVFDILLEGKVVKKNLDQFVENGNKQLELIFRKIVVKDGNMTINLISSVADASISGIAIFPSNEKNSNMSNLRQFTTNDFEATENSNPFESESTNAKLYPNPASSEVNLVLESEYSNSKILIHDTAGQLVSFYNPSQLNVTGKVINIPLLNLRQGIYILSVTSEKGIQFKEKLMIIK